MQYINIVHTSLKSSLGKKNGHGGDIISSDTLGATFKAWGDREGYFQIWDMESGLTDYAQFVGPHKPSMSRLFFDFDSSEDIEQARIDAVKLTEKLIELGGDTTKIITRFSGSKGFHVSVPSTWFNIADECYDEHANFKAFLNGIKSDYATLDTSVSAQVSRMRVPGSKHNKSGLYSTRLTFAELRVLTLTEIKAKAETQVVPLDDECLPAVGNKVTKITAWYEDTVSVIRNGEEADLFQNEMSSFATYPDKPCIKELEKAVLPEASRHHGIVVLAAHYLHTKVPEHTAHILTQAFANRQTIDDERKEKEPKGVVKAVYRARIGYQFGCKESLKAARCSTLCPIREKLKPENKPEISAEKIEAERIHLDEHPEDKPEPLTKHSGFWYTGPKGGVFPDYEGLLEEFLKQYHYKKYLLPKKETGISGKIPMVYNGKYWTMVDDLEDLATGFTEVEMNPKPKQSIRREFANKVYNSNLINGYDRKIQLSGSASDFFEKSTVGKLNLTNGVLDLASGTLSPHSHKYSFRCMLSFGYEKDAKCPVFKQFIHDICGGDQETITRIMLFIAYALVDVEYSRHYFLYLVGTGGNGKGTLINFIKEFFGQSYAEAGINNILGQFGGKCMEGKLIATIDELSGEKTSMEAWARIKELTGKGSLRVEAKNKDEYRVPATAKLIFLSNGMPSMKDNSEGMQRRALFVQLDKSFTREGVADIGMLGKLISERAGVLNWLLEEWVPKYKASGIPKNTAQDDLVEKTLMRGSDPLYAWFEACVVQDGASSKEWKAHELFHEFILWAKEVENGFRPEDVEKYSTQRKLTEFLMLKLGRIRTKRCREGVRFSGIRVMNKDSRF